MNATFQQHLPASARHPSRASSAVATLALDPAGRAIQLGKRQNLTLRDAVGWTVQTLGGAVWITQDWDTRDIVLEAGQSFVIDRPGTALISAFDHASVCVVREPNRCAAASRAAKPRPAASFSARSPVPA